LIFDRERPRVRKRGAAVQSNVLDRQEKFPERLRHFGILAPRRQQKVNRQDREVGRHDSQRPPGEETTEINALIARKRGEELAADQITAEDKEKIDTDPTEAINPAGHFESEERGVVNDDDDNRKRAEKIETRLTLAILKARINGFRRQ
jgi:hypothetical protein